MIKEGRMIVRCTIFFLISIIFICTADSTAAQNQPKLNEPTANSTKKTDSTAERAEKLKKYKQKLIDEAIKKGIKPEVYFGLTCVEFSKNNKTAVAIKKINKNGLAYSNGIKSRYIIVSINGEKIKTIDELENVINGLKIGDEVSINLKNNNSKDVIKKTFKITPNYPVSVSNYYYNKALDYFESGNYKEALTELYKSLLVNPCNRKAFNLRKGIKDLTSKEEKQNIDSDYYDPAFPRNSSLRKNKYSLLYDPVINVICAARKESADKALDMLEKYLEYNPDNPEILYEISRIYLKEKQYEKGKVIIDKAIKLVPDNPYFLVLKGEYLLKNHGMYKEAEKCYKRAAELRPEWYLPHYKLGLLYNRYIGRKEALVELNKALKLFPSEEILNLYETIKILRLFQ